MQQLRCEIDGDMEDMAASARTMVDWKHYVKTYPWVCLGAAAALGFLIVPKRSRAIRPDVATLTELAKTGHLVVKPAPATAREWSMRYWLPSPASRFARHRIFGPKCRKITGNNWSARDEPS